MLLLKLFQNIFPISQLSILYVTLNMPSGFTVFQQTRLSQFSVDLLPTHPWRGYWAIIGYTMCVVSGQCAERRMSLPIVGTPGTSFRQSNRITHGNFEPRPPMPWPTQGQLDHSRGDRPLDSSGEACTLHQATRNLPAQGTVKGRTPGFSYKQKEIIVPAYYNFFSGHVPCSLPQLPYGKTVNQSAVVIVSCCACQ